MFHYVSIPDLDHKVFKYAEYRSNDTGASNWHVKNGITGSDSEIAKGPYRVLSTVEYLGDRINKHGDPFDEPSNFTPKQIVITRRRGDSVIVEMWVRRTYPGEINPFRQRVHGIQSRLHFFPLEEPNATAKAIAQHIETDLRANQ